MDPRGWGEIALTLAVTVALGWPLGIYMARVWQGERTWLDPVLGPVERVYNALMGLKPGKGQGWLAYTLSLLAFSATSFLILYVILRLQGRLPLNPQGFAALARAFAANRGEALGNFWTDLFRISFYILLPVSVAIGLALAVLGVPQTLLAHVDAHTIEGAKQSIALGPVASQEAIKMLGAN